MKINPSLLATRLRRLRYNSVVRDLVRENKVDVEDLVCPIFVKYGKGIKTPLSSMPGQFQISVDLLNIEIKEICDLGIKAVLVFGLPEHKNNLGTDTYSKDGIVQQAIREIKRIAPDLLVISDVCLCQYTEHGHCGVLDQKDDNLTIDNDSTLELLAKQAVSHVQAGADIIAPSGMMDGMVKAIRYALDYASFSHIPILSYAVKYRSSMYGPFGQATEGAAKVGDRRTYQMDPSNGNAAFHEAKLDIEEGADMLIIKPAHTYLDIIYRIKSAFSYVPIAAYHVSGEYSMLKAAIQNGWLEEKRTVIEVLTSMKRAGADILITYYAKDVARWLKENHQYF